MSAGSSAPTAFFQRQQDARRRTLRLLVVFAVAVAAVVLLLDIVVLAFFNAPPTEIVNAFRESPLGMSSLSGLIALCIAFASWRKARELAAGGGAVARSLGGHLVTDANATESTRRLLNVVEEISLAAGIASPAVYVLPRERGINAFAAGHTVDDAAIAVTEGALRAFNREELQAVIGHEFSHVLNGDMALNLRLVAWLHGLAGVSRLGMRLIRRDDGKWRNIRFVVFGALVVAVGAVGYWIGRLLQASVSRRREELADASAVQFTRNPEALKNALLKIVGVQEGSEVVAPKAPEVAHMFFASAAGRRPFFDSGLLFATHPSVVDRIRALDPSFDRRALGRLAREAAARVPPPDAASAGLLVQNARAASRSVVATSLPDGGAYATATAAAAATASARATATATATVGPAAPATIAAVAPARAEADEPGADPATGPRRPPPPYPVAAEAPPPSTHSAHALRDLQQHARTPARAVAAALAAVTTTYLPRRRKQLAAIERAFGADEARTVERILSVLDLAPPRGRLLALVPAFEALMQLPPAERVRLTRAVALLALHEPAPSTLQVCAARLVANRCTGSAPSGEAPLPADLCHLAPLVAVIARLGHVDPADQARAYFAGVAPFVAAGAPAALAAPADWPGALREACDAVTRLHPAARRAYLNVLARAALVDGRLGLAEAELLRTVSLVARVPLPDLSSATSLRDEPLPAVAASAG